LEVKEKWPMAVAFNLLQFDYLRLFKQKRAKRKYSFFSVTLLLSLGFTDYTD
jgi:hypothetical protein